jgi:glycosyltransferase involved in cell wall biosynthesis
MRAFSLARKLPHYGYEVILFASRVRVGISMLAHLEDDVRIEEMPDLLPRRIRNGGLSPIDTVMRMVRVLFHEVDLVQTFDHRPAVLFPALIAKLRWGAIWISDWADLWGVDGIGRTRGGIWGRLLTWFDEYFESRIRRWADGVTVIGTELYERAERQGARQEKLHTLPPGSNIDLIQPMSKVDAREVFHLPINSPILGFSGFAPYDQELLANVVIEFLNLNGDGWVIACGQVPILVSRLIAHHRFSSRFRDFGVLPFNEVGRCLACADVLILPYTDTSVNRGRFPNKFGDYLAVGRPVATNPTGDLGEIVLREELGIVVEENPLLMAQSITQLIHDHNMCERIGERARRYAEESNSWHVLAAEVSFFYQGFAGVGPGSLEE